MAALVYVRNRGHLPTPPKGVPISPLLPKPGRPKLVVINRRDGPDGRIALSLGLIPNTTFGARKKVVVYHIHLEGPSIFLCGRVSLSFFYRMHTSLQRNLRLGINLTPLIAVK